CKRQLTTRNFFCSDRVYRQHFVHGAVSAGAALAAGVAVESVGALFGPAGARDCSTFNTSRWCFNCCISCNFFSCSSHSGSNGKSRLLRKSEPRSRTLNCSPRMKLYFSPVAPVIARASRIIIGRKNTIRLVLV